MLTKNFVVSIESFYMLESFRNNGDIYKLNTYMFIAYNIQ